MTVMVSACLLGENCKYNGGNNKNKTIIDLLKGHTVIPVCPELLGGLSVPRSPCEIVNGVVMNRDGENVDREFRLGAAMALKLAQFRKIDFAVLQSRSPSCGKGIIYDGTFSGKKINGNGIFAEKLLENSIPVYDASEIDEITKALLP